MLIAVRNIQDGWVWVGVWSEFSCQPLTVLSVSLAFLLHLQMCSHLVRHSIAIGGGASWEQGVIVGGAYDAGVLFCE